MTFIQTKLKSRQNVFISTGGYFLADFWTCFRCFANSGFFHSLGINCSFAHPNTMAIRRSYANILFLFFFIVARMTGQTDSAFFNKLTIQFRTYLKSDIDSAKKIAKHIEAEANRRDYKRGKGLANNYLGICALSGGNYPLAINHFNKALVFLDSTKKSKGICDVYSNLGVCYDYLGQFNEAIRFYLKSLSVAEAIDDDYAIGTSCNNLGTIYFQQKNNKQAMDYFMRSLHVREKRKDDYGIASCCLNIASCLDAMKDLDQAARYLEKCITYANLAGDSVLIADANTSLGENFARQKNYQKALTCFEKSLAIVRAFNDTRSISAIYYYMGRMKMEQHEYKTAHHFFLESFLLAKDISNTEGVKKGSQGLVASSAYLDMPDSVSYYMGQYETARDSLYSESSARQIADMQTKYETDKKDTELKLKEEQIKSKSAENTKQRVMIVASVVALAMSLVAVFFVYRSFRQKKQSVIEISAQKKIIEEKNKDITDSIKYAKRIQEVILPPQENATPLFSESFILFLPKDVVSGDFYWYCRKGDKKLVAAVDCTGHGVPGALMSMLGNAFLNEIVNEKNILQPSEILSELRHRVKTALKQTGEVGEAKDGMDMALLCFNDDNTVVEYAGAHNPLWIFKKGPGGYALKEYGADKRPVGYFIGKSLPFTNHTIELEKGDTLYIFSDGYGDQFGGPKGKKFKSAQLRQLLLSVQDSSMTEQKNILQQAFIEWKGRHEQIDDVCVIGIRV